MQCSTHTERQAAPFVIAKEVFQICNHVMTVLNSKHGKHSKHKQQACCQPALLFKQHKIYGSAIWGGEKKDDRENNPPCLCSLHVQLYFT